MPKLVYFISVVLLMDWNGNRRLIVCYVVLEELICTPGFARGSHANLVVNLAEILKVRINL